MVHHLSTVEVERLLAGEREGRRLYRWKKWKIFENNLEMKKVTRVFYHTGKLGPRRNRGRRRAGEQVWQRAFKSRWGQRVDPRARSTRCLLQLPAMNTMSLRPKNVLRQVCAMWSCNHYCSYENDVVVSQQHVHIALSQDVSMISKNRRKLLRQF